MRAIPWQAAAFLLLVVSAGCTKSSDPAVPLPVRVTVSDNEVLANGTNSVTVSVTDPAGGPITVTTDRGTFPGGVQTATVAGAAGTLALTTCDASTTSGCAGTVHLSAAGAGTAAARTLTFGTLASLCPANCAVDPGCATLACTRSGGGTGVCSSTVPSACLSASACTPSPAGEPRPRLPRKAPITTATSAGTGGKTFSSAESTASTAQTATGGSPIIHSRKRSSTS